MLRRASQVVGRHCFNLAHILIDLAIGLVAVVVIAAGALSLRLSRGPIGVDALVRPMIAQLNREGPTQLRLGHVELAWSGWKKQDEPVQLHVQRVEVFAVQNGHETALAGFPDASVALSLSRLLIGQLRPRAITINGADLHVTRAVDGSIALDVGSLVEQTESTGPSASLVELGLLAGNPNGVLAELVELHIQGARIGVTDQGLGTNWRIAGADLLFRRRRGVWRGTASLPLAIGATTLNIAGDTVIGPSGSHVSFTTSPVMPSDLAAAAPVFARLSALKAPLSLSVAADLTPAFAPTHWQIAAKLGAGTMAVANGLVPLAGGRLSVAGSDQQASINQLALDLPSPDGAVSHVTGTGLVNRGTDGVTASLAVNVDQVNFSDLPGLWPFGVAASAREWVTNNITAGSVHDVHVDLAATAQSDFSGFQLTTSTGTAQADDFTLRWLNDVPGIIHAHATINLLDRDNLAILIHSGQQETPAINGATPTLALTGGSFTISAMRLHPQGTLAVDANGALPDLLTLLAVPRLHLLARYPVNFTFPQGAITAHLDLSLPLTSHVLMKDIIIAGKLHGANVHLGQVAAGHDLDRATIDLTVNNDGLQAAGHGNYAQIPADMAYAIDFRAGGPDEVLQHLTAHGSATPAQLAAAGYDPVGFLDQGLVPLDVVYDQTRDDHGKLAISADLANVSLKPQFGWTKPIGAAGHASGLMLFHNAALVDVPTVTVTAPGLALAAQIGIAAGHISTINFSHLQLDKNDLAGSVRFPGSPGDPYRLRLAGSVIDLSNQFKHTDEDQDQDHGPNLVIDAAFDRALMAGGQSIDHLVSHTETNQGVTHEAIISFGADRQTTLEIAPAIQGRRLRIRTSDAGQLFAATDILSDLRGGDLSLEGRYDDTKPQHPLTGVATITNFRIHNAPAITKLLQALTGYGLVALARGPDLAITTLTTSFTLQQNLLTLKDAQAHSASIGFTAGGTVNLASSLMDLHGTIVPAYLFNNALSHLPFAGALFSAEQGGGILSMTYSVTGPHDSPRVSVNPLSAAAPGFLRGIFKDK